MSVNTEVGMLCNVTNGNRLIFIVFLCVPLCFSLSGCSKLLPRSQEVTLSRWHSFAKVKSAYDQIQPGDSVEELAVLGFDLEKTPNMQLLNYTELAALFQTIPLSGLAPELQGCLQNPDSCQAYTYDLQRMRSRRVGNFWADLFNFHRKTDIRGWKFRMLLVLNEGQVVYKLWSGTASIKKYVDKRNPLGPLQDSGDELLRLAR